MLDWVGPKKKLSDQDVGMLLSSKFATRLYLERKIIEYAELCEGDTGSALENKKISLVNLIMIKSY